MPVKIRLARRGRKKYGFYHIVAADSRAPRDGKFIEKLGSYNPNTNPATIELDFDKAIDWLQKGAQPTDTCRTILSYRGVMYKNHLNKGVLKGALTEEQATAKFEAWLVEKDAKIQAKIDSLSKSKQDADNERFEEEKAINEARAAEIAKRKIAELEGEAEAEATEETATEEAPAEAPAEESAE